jgi:hypothetical protein
MNRRGFISRGLAALRKKIWPLRSDYTEREFYALPIAKQRRILGLGEGHNPPKPSFLSAPNPTPVPTPITAEQFTPEIFETAELCDEVLGDLVALPTNRFYEVESLTITALARGWLAKDQAALDWLFDLRRVTKQDIEGSTYLDMRTSEQWPLVKMFKRPVLVPQLNRIYA